MEVAFIKLLRVLLPLGILLTFWHCEKRQVPPEVLAQVGHRYITVDEFVNRAELSPPPNFRRVNGFSDKRALLELLIGEKLLANEAETLGLQSDASFKAWQRYTEGIAVVKELYRDEVLSKVEVREGEIDTAMALAQKSLQIKFFKTAQQEDADRFLKNLQEKKSFDLVMKNYFGEAISPDNYTSHFTFGDGDENLERAVFVLQPGQISEVINTSRGFWVVQVLSAKGKPPLTQSEYLKQYASLKKILRARKADKLSAQFVRDFMRDKDVALKGKTFSLLTKYFEQQLDFNNSSPALKMQPLGEMGYRHAEDNLRDHLDTPLIVFAGGQWSIRETLAKLRLRNLPFNHESPATMRKTLERDLQEMVRDEFLAQEGYRRKLNKRPEVQEEVRMWVDHHLYTLMVGHLGLQPQSMTEINFPPPVSKLKDKYPAIVFEDKLKQIHLTSLNMIAVHAGRPNQLAVPLWPIF